MIVLGVDPGMRRANPAGWAVVDTTTTTVLACGVLRPASDLADWEARVAWSVAQLPPILSRYAVSYVACEDAFFKRNLETFRQLVAFGWEVRVAARAWGCPFVLVNPADQARVLATLPDELLGPATAHLPRTLRDHARSAIAIALHGGALHHRAHLLRRAS